MANRGAASLAPGRSLGGMERATIARTGGIIVHRSLTFSRQPSVPPLSGGFISTMIFSAIPKKRNIPRGNVYFKTCANALRNI